MCYLSCFFKKVIPALLFSACLLLPFTASAQENGTPCVERIMPKVSFVNPAVGFEFGLGKKTTLATQALLGFNFTYHTSPNDGSGYYSVLYPALQTEIRYYYSQERRQRMGKNWRGNSGAFWGGEFVYRFDAISERINGDVILNKPYQPSISFGPIWGLQLTEIKSHFNFSFSFGPTLTYLQDGEASFQALGRGHLNLGFVIGEFK